MKKIFSLFAAVLFAGSMMADSYTITFKEGSGETSDGSAKQTTIEGIISDGAQYVSEVAATEVYNARIGRGIKLGTGSKTGSLVLTLATPVKVTSIVVNARKYNDTEKTLIIQDKNDYELDGGDAFQDYTYTYASATEVSSITLGTVTKRNYLKSVTVNYEAGGAPTTLTAPDAAPAAPTYPANQVKAVYSETYGADCGFGEWGSATQYSQDTYGKKYVTTNLGYFGLLFEGDNAKNCSQMEALHLDIWIAEDASVGIVPIHGGTEVRVTKNLVGQQWNAIDIPLADFTGVTDWSNVYQIKLDNIANQTFWVNNVYFYTTVAPAADVTAPSDFTAVLESASYFSVNIKAHATDASGAVIYNVLNGEEVLATANGASDADKVITVSGLNPGTAYNLSVVAKDESGNAATPIAVAATTLAAPAPAAAPTYAADKVLALVSGAYTNLAYEIQDWWAMPAVVKGNLVANEPALCLLPNETGGSCFGLAFAKTDITAYDALEMDVYPTVENAKLKTQVIGDNANLPAATEYNLVANQWNHIVLNIKGNTKADCEQVGFYDCNNLLAACFVQNVLFVDTDVPVINPITCADVYNKAKNDVVDLLNPVTVTFANGKNVWVKDETASMLIYLPANGTYQAGDVLTGVAGVVDIYNGVTEIKPSADQVAAITVAAGEAPAAEVVATVTTADVNKYIVMKGVEAEGAFAEGSQSNITINGVVVRNQFKNGYTFEAGKTYNVYGVVTIYSNNPQVYFITAEEAGGVTPGETIDVVATSVRWSDNTEAEGWWQIYGTAGEWNFSISNISATEAPGTYTMAEDLDPDWTYLKKYDEEDEVVDSVYFVGGQVVVAISAEGVVTVVGALVGENGNTYNFNLTYKDPVAETTVNIEIPEWQVADTYFAYYGIFAIAGEAANGDYVQLDLVTDGETIAGVYTEEDEDPYEVYGSGIVAGGAQQGIFSFTATIEEQAENGRAIVTADILCFNNTLYHVTTLVGEGVDNIDAAMKAIKSIVNGQLIIEKNGKTYNAQGAVVR